jgi:DNA polymerase elongation subunit (family B)
MHASDHALVFGRSPDPGLVAVEHAPSSAGDRMILFRRSGGRVSTAELPFRPFLWLESAVTISGCAAPHEVVPLDGGGDLRALARFPTWKAFDQAVSWLRTTTGRVASDPRAPYFTIQDPVQQFLMESGRTLFHGLSFAGLRRMQVDIETQTEDGYEFSNPDREGDRILAIGMADSAGWSETIDGSRLDEPAMLRRLVAAVRERDPDVIEGHNLFAFDLDYLARRARRHGIALAIGRDGSAPRARSGRFVSADRTVNYPRVDVFGRAILDTYFLVQIYDAGHRSLPGFGLKEVARHFGFSPAGREMIEGGEIGRVFRTDPARVLRYLADDVRETAALAGRLAPVVVAQARVVPMGLQNVALRGSAAKIDALMLREYLAAGASVPRPGAGRAFEGGLTDLFETGVIRNVHHCDVRSLYPSLMLAEGLGPASDRLGVFLRLLRDLREFRLAAKDRMRAATDDGERAFEEALQSTFKILINSFYGYLGFEMARFNDFDAAGRVTARGREVLGGMVDAIRAAGGRPVEIDTDGVYFVPPEGDAAGLERFRAGVRSTLPRGIELEFDDEFEAMFSYRRKNYALLARDGEILITGAALRSRGLEPFLRDYIREFLDARLRGRDGEIPELTARYRRAIVNREWPVRRLARTERLQDAPETYAAKQKAGARGRNAAYELALASGRTYRAGDAISYYVTGDRKSVAVHAAARLVSDWDPDRRDENVPYYVAKLEDLVARLATVGGDDPEPAPAPRRRPARRKAEPT